MSTGKLLISFSIAVFFIGCAALIPQIKLALDSSQIREYVIGMDESGALMCVSAQVTIDETGKWTARDFKEHSADDCFKDPLFAYSKEDRAAIEALFESFADAYYDAGD